MKAINSIVNRQEDDQDSKNVIRLESVDVLHPKGSRIRVVVKEKQRNPHTKLVVAVRAVTYLYDNEKQSTGYEIVKEISIPVSEVPADHAVKVVESITRDYRTPVVQK